jgi:redox-regulated HSP33 family molecular chaperone
MALDDGHIRVTCEFCNRHYDFEAHDFIQDARQP